MDATAIRVRFAYFGWSCEFTTTARTIDERRAEANAHVITGHGLTPPVSYVEPGLPFPAYVPQMVWDEQDQVFY